jgi:chorismate mutase
MSTAKQTAEQTLAGFRARIDAIDAQLSALLIERTGIIHEVAALKREHWPNGCHIRPGREGQMHRAIANRFSGSLFPPLAALTIWRQLIGASTHLESPLNATVIDATHAWLAREYFGVQIGIAHAHSFTDALPHLADGRSNLLILPTPETSDWWHHAALLAAQGVFVFAALPVALGTLPEGASPAVALAAVTPEPSGDDVSYFVRDGMLEIVDGFASSRDGAIFIGAHPRAITLGA